MLVLNTIFFPDKLYMKCFMAEVKSIS